MLGRRRNRSATGADAVGSGPNGRDPVRRILNGLLVASSIVVIVGTVTVVLGLAAGYRPVVILTGSMGETAPPRSLIVAEPRPATTIAVGDIVVMRRPEQAPITHRVIEIESNGEHRFAITQGDANEAPDAAPYPLDGEQLVARWIKPRLGQWILTLFQPGPALALVALATTVIAIQALRWIWTEPVSVATGPGGDRATTAGSRRRTGRTDGPRWRRPGRRLAVLGTAPLVAISGLGVAWALFTAADPVPDNQFGTADCFDPQLASVQDGETIHAVSGTVTVPITGVVASRSFVLASVRSASGEPADSTALVRLSSDGSAVEIDRITDNGTPPAVTVAWSVVEYACGLSVQHGVNAGDGSSSLAIPVAAFDPARSFVILGSRPGATDQDFGDDDLVRSDISDGSNLIIESAGAPLGADRSFGWQIITFNDPADAVVQTVDVTLGSGATATTAVLPGSAKPTNTFLLTQVTSSSSGADIGERLVRARMIDGNQVEITRSVGGDAVDVRIQVVDLRDGTTVRHGKVDFASTETSKPIAIDPVDTDRATAISTVAVPGPSAGGRTDHVADDVVGEASATFVVVDGTTISVERASSASNASFGWQLIEWAGPRWWDADYLFRQRIDVETDIVAAPNGYTVPIGFDHAALVDIGGALANGTDVRVVRWNGAAWVELDRVLDDASGWNQADTTINFKTASAIEAESVSSYWLYFGNPTPAPVLDDPENVYLLVEDFESGTMGDFEDRTAGTGWYSADPWTRRIPVTVSAAQVATDLTDFPLLVSLTNATLAAEAQSDGSDIRFVAGDGLTALAHEIERYEPATGELVAWVRVPTLSASSDTTVYLLFGAANAPDQQNVRGTWSDSALGVWHLARNPSGSSPQIDDSTIRNLDGVSRGAMSSGDLVAGRIGRAVDFDGSDDRADLSPLNPGGRTSLSMSAWVRLDSTTADGAVLSKRGSGSTWFELSVAAGGAASVTLNTSTAGETTLTGGTVGTGVWRHLAATWDGTTARLHIDGVEVAQQGLSGVLLPTNDAMAIGAASDGSIPVDGVVDEVRIDGVARSSDWIGAEYANQSNPAAFASAGAAQVGSWLGAGSWAYRKPLSIDADTVAADVSPFVFPVLVDDADVQGAALADGADLVFTDADGTTRLDHVLETYSTATGSIRAWVRLPSVSSTTDTDFFLYYGNPGAVDQQDPGATFGSDADLVFLGRP